MALDIPWSMAIFPVNVHDGFFGWQTDRAKVTCLPEHKQTGSEYKDNGAIPDKRMFIPLRYGVMRNPVIHINLPRHEGSCTELRYLKLGVATVLACVPAICSAYVGPGAGLTMLGALWAVILAVVFIVGGLLLWPIRTLLRRRKSEPQTASGSDEISEASAAVKKESPDS